ncbi:hypothetical protein L1987_57607 [Smallanthus sonchifolius]|uniref:Uncharacterized protein n=1 Tax=Smallanthus sonchifolius TaxID=185202 RepID=A0ACB9DD26_9ASTR|nr:hypothetical protein L1987_57607 [Smallanthus sonchifolius]
MRGHVDWTLVVVPSLSVMLALISSVGGVSPFRSAFERPYQPNLPVKVHILVVILFLLGKKNTSRGSCVMCELEKVLVKKQKAR